LGFELFQALQPISDKEDITHSHRTISGRHTPPQRPSSMASICYSLSLPPNPKPPNSKIIRPFPTYLSNPNSCPSSIPTFRSFRTRANKLEEEAQKPNEISMSIDNIHSFFDLNLGKWNGSFFVSLCSIALDILYFLRLSSLFAG
jgi:hypothetical protein